MSRRELILKTFSAKQAEPGWGYNSTTSGIFGLQVQVWSISTNDQYLDVTQITMTR